MTRRPWREVVFGSAAVKPVRPPRVWPRVTHSWNGFGLAVFLLVAGCEAESAGGAGGEGGLHGSGGAATTATGQTGSTGASGAAALGPEHCPAEPAVGTAVGDRLGDLLVRDCDGSEVRLENYCGAAGLWIFAAHGWCPLCQSVSEKQEEILAEYADRGLVALNVVVETGASESTTDAYCELWRDTHKHEKVVTLHDPTGEILSLWPGGTTSLSLCVGGDRTIRSKLEHVSSETAIRGELDALFAE